MKTWDAWAPSVLPFVPQCSVPMMGQELLMASREFFAFTKDWQEWTDPVASVAGVTQYDIDVPPGAEVVHVDAAQMDSAPIGLLNWRTLGRPVSTASAFIAAAPCGDLLGFEVSGTPGDGQQIQLLVTCIPSMNSLGIPDALATRHWSALSYGALSRLMMLKDFGFFDPQRAAVYGRAFEEAKGREQYRAYRNQSSAMPRARLKTF